MSKFSKKKVWKVHWSRLLALLFSRTVFFAFFQSMIALLLHSWNESEKYWLLTATLTNIVSFLLLNSLFKNENIRFLSIYRFDKENWKKDVSIFLGLALISIPLVLVPGSVLSIWFWGDATYYNHLLVRSIPVPMVYFLFIAFPTTIALTELATYFAYIMPRLKDLVNHSWVVVLLPVAFLALQHCTLPLIFEPKFIIFRGLMYLPFSLMLGIALYKRPSLLPHLAILHGLIDVVAVAMLLK